MSLQKRVLSLLLLAELLRELTYTFMYVAVEDDRTCLDCLSHDRQIFSGSDAESSFMYLSKEPDDSVWHPNVHPHCRCLLILLEIGM